MAAARKKAAPKQITLQRLQETVIEVPIRGITPVIPHKWSEKSKAMMPGHPDREAIKKAKGVRNPEEEATACQYLLDGVPCMPATAFKGAIVDACRFFDAPSMTEAKCLIYVEGYGPDGYVPIKFGERILREDPARNASGTADLRYRYAYSEWSATLTIRFVTTSLTKDAVVALVDAAGRYGVGDWRPSAPKAKTGTYGTWRVDETATINEVAPNEVTP